MQLSAYNYRLGPTSNRQYVFAFQLGVGGFQNWSQKFLGLSIDAFFCPERLSEILWETENPMVK
eukprot:SAG11_NODE_2709_length_3060_cov_2.574806_1_plen_64_part_00